jgi:hypothetical protein
MRRLFVLITVWCALAAAGACLAASAGAAGVPAPVADCLKNGQLTHHYAPAELQHALATMAADVGEYSNCQAVIQQALYADIGNLHGDSGSGGGSFLPTWLLVLLIVLVLGGAGFAAVAIRRRRSPE